VLLAVLIVIVVLALAAYRYSDLMVSETRASDSALRAAQARSLAISGVHFAAAALADANTVNAWNGNVFDNPSAFRNVSVNADDRLRFAGRFSLPSPPPVDDALNGSTQTRFGVLDESSKINVNALVATSADRAYEILLKLPNMTEEIADAIIDWIDTDVEARANGAENEFYGGLSNGYRCKNGPLDTLDELLLVRGVTPQLLFGTDRNHNGRADAGEDDGNGFDPGWAAYLTVFSRELNRDSEGQPRIYLNDADINGLYEKLNTALGEDAAAFIVGYRLYGGQTSSGGSGANSGRLTKSELDMARRPQASISSVFALINATVALPQAGGNSGGGNSRMAGGGQPSPGSQTTVVVTSSPGGAAQGRSGAAAGGGSASRSYSSPLANESTMRDLLPKLLDKCTTRRDAEIPARVNMNTAPRAVIASLPGLEETDVQAIIDNRRQPGSAEAADPVFQSLAWLRTEANLPVSKLQTLERYITARTQTYRVQSLGYFDQGGPVARVEAVIDTNGGQPRIIYFRDLTELGRGFEVPR